jgi:hypothetical protein
VRFATALDERFPATAAALAGARVNPEQAKVVAEAVDRLTEDHGDELPDGTRERAEAHLLDLAADHDAKALRRLGKRLFEVVCPEAADAAEGEQLAKDEERARRTAQLSLRDNGDGTHEGRFRLPTLHAALLKKALDALTSPRRLGQDRLDPETGKPLGYRALLGRGLMDLLENHLDLGSMPGSGRSPFTLVVTGDVDALTTGVGAATLESGARISAGEFRRLACKAGIIPMILDGESVPLDLGREQRFFTKHQQVALRHRYGGVCATDGCDSPWVEFHHIVPWAKGGRTDLANGLPLCPAHHHMADHPETWDMRLLPNGAVRFRRRQ